MNCSFLKRQFFLENTNIFANFGYDNIHTFSREELALTTQSWGFRLSGNIDENGELVFLTLTEIVKINLQQKILVLIYKERF